MIVHSDPYCEVHHADCLDAEAVAEAMGKLRADALIFDAPFSAKTHKGHADGKLTAERAAKWSTSMRAKGRDSGVSRYGSKRGEGAMRREIEYAHFDAEQIATFCNIWLLLCNGWIVSITDMELVLIWVVEFD
jgi:hypothetical protein